MARTDGSTRSNPVPSGLLPVLIGLAAVTLSRSVGGFLGGFLGGALGGAGLALLLIGVYQLGARLRPRRDRDTTRRAWLPSRDSRR